MSKSDSICIGFSDVRKKCFSKGANLVPTGLTCYKRWFDTFPQLQPTRSTKLLFPYRPLSGSEGRLSLLPRASWFMNIPWLTTADKGGFRQAPPLSCTWKRSKTTWSTISYQGESSKRYLAISYRTNDETSQIFQHFNDHEARLWWRSSSGPDSLRAGPMTNERRRHPVLNRGLKSRLTRNSCQRDAS